MSKPVTYEQAVNMLDEYMQKLTTHSTRNVIHHMTFLCNTLQFNYTEDKIDFAQQCSNFDLWVRETGRTSIGRKQFEEWWEIQGTSKSEDFSDEANIEYLTGDPLPEEFGTVHITHVDDPTATINEWTEVDKLKARINRLERELKEYEDVFKVMNKLMNKGKSRSV